jgi:beta-ketodecanoyl-[acyl-carrier-protein] synthase
VLGYDPSETQAPIILDRYANTSSAGSIIAFHLHHEQFNQGDIGVICSFGAGYSAGSVVIRRV